MLFVIRQVGCVIKMQEESAELMALNKMFVLAVPIVILVKITLVLAHSIRIAPKVSNAGLAIVSMAGVWLQMVRRAPHNFILTHR